MTDQSVAARLARAEDTLNLLMTALCERGSLSIAEVKLILRSADNLARDGVRATAPGASHVSAAVARIIHDAKDVLR